MKYKVLKGTDTYRKLKEAWDKIIQARTAAKNLVVELAGGDTEYTESYHVIAGGLSGIKMPSKPDGWKNANTYPGHYFPKKCNANKELLERIEALPTVTFSDLNDAVGFKRQRVGKTMHNCIGAHNGEEFCLFEVDEECKFTPPADAIEITISEYRELSKIIANNATKE